VHFNQTKTEKLEGQSELVPDRHRRQVIPPDAQRPMSKLAGSTVVEVQGSHAIYVSPLLSNKQRYLKEISPEVDV
jgi:hypothetical protein